MKCHNPFMSSGGQAFGCGQCLPCRINRRRIWAHRIKLESVLHAENAFLTLTYADGCMPLSSKGLGTLNRTHTSMFLDRVRSQLRRGWLYDQPRTIRYFLVGEYGDLTFRPHYHAVLFNYPSCERGRTRSPPKFKRCCGPCDFIYDNWYQQDDKGDKQFLGKIELLPLSHALMTYIGGYVTKKMTRADDPRLEGRAPEFASQSKFPGIGYNAMHDVADMLMRYYDVRSELGDVPSVLGSGKSDLPIGRYLRRTLRSMVGMSKDAPQATIDKMADELLSLRLAAREDEENPSIKARVIERDKGKVASLEARYRIFKQRRSL